MTAAAPGSQKTWTILELLRWTTEHFASRGIEIARAWTPSACWPTCWASIGCGSTSISKRPSARATARPTASSSAAAPNERVPVAQLVGVKEFWSLPLKVTRDVLVPRPDTETLVTAALDLLPDPEARATVLDVGTGSGAVALAIAVERPRAHLVATDISQAALEIARENADVHGVADRIRWAWGSLFEPVAGQRFDAIVSNPPYVAESQRGELPPELAHEPEEALFGGEDGTALLAELIAQGGRDARARRRRWRSSWRRSRPRGSRIGAGRRD